MGEEGRVSQIHCGYLGDSHPHVLVPHSLELPRVVCPPAVVSLSERFETAEIPSMHRPAARPAAFYVQGPSSLRPSSGDTEEWEEHVVLCPGRLLIGSLAERFPCARPWGHEEE